MGDLDDHPRAPATSDPAGELPVGDRGSAGWGRLAEKWFPDSLHDARVDPGRRGGRVLAAVAAIAAVLAAVGVWMGRPEPRPVQAVALAPATATPTRETLQPSTGNRSSAAAGSSGGSAVRSPPADRSTVPATIIVSVTGAVRRPGIVRLSGEARVADAIQAAGGITDAAELTGLNLAAKLTDGASVVVGSATGVAGAVVTSPAGALGQPADQPTTAMPGAPGPAGLLDLNTADQAALEALPGVGPVMAGNIIEWRSANGPFTSVEQLREISGIGPTRFAQLAPLVAV